jgi:hypothetical protein
MKKNRLILVAIVLLAAATSCSKEQITMNTSNGSTNSNEMLSSQSDADGKVISEKADGNNFRRVWRDNGGFVDGRDFGCFGYGGNCLDEVVVVGIAGPIGDLEVTSPNNYVKLLKNKTAEFANFLPEEMIQKVISGNAQLSTKGSIVRGVLYVIFSEGDEVSLVAPFRLM